MLLKISHLCACLGLLLAASANADSINYTIQFTTTSGTAPTSGSFTYDSATSLFSNFLVEWDIYNFDLTAAANAPTTRSQDARIQTELRHSNCCRTSAGRTAGWRLSRAPVRSPMPFTGFPSRSLSPLGRRPTSQPTAPWNHSGAPRISSGAGNWTIVPGRRV